MRTPYFCEGKNEFGEVNEVKKSTKYFSERMNEGGASRYPLLSAKNRNQILKPNRGRHEVPTQTYPPQKNPGPSVVQTDAEINEIEAKRLRQPYEDNEILVTYIFEESKYFATISVEYTAGAESLKTNVINSYRLDK